ncbi:anti-sigma factor family protein [Planctomycetota bacterium]
MNCTEYQELLVGYAEGLLSESQKQAVELHLQDCPSCRLEFAELTQLQDQLVSNSEAWGQSKLENKVMNQILREQGHKLRKVNKQLKVWRIIMKSRITKLAAAAVIIIAVVFSVTMFDKTMPTAYAFEQTIEACHSVRWLHMISFDEGVDEPKECWLECDELGQIESVRLYLPEWASPDDGPKVIAWQQGKAQIWVKRKNILATIWEKDEVAKLLEFLESHDPKGIVERFQLQQRERKVKMDIDEPKDKSEPIVVTVTYLPQSSTPNKREVLFVDQATKLVTAIEVYHLKNGDYKQTGVMEFFDYNQRIAPEMFFLDDEVPDDVSRIDMTTHQTVGLSQGDLTDKQIAVKIVRQFFEALIAKDYEKAGRLLSGLSTEKIEEFYGKIDFIRIVSIGEPTDHSKTKSLRVPCEVEIRQEGKVTSFKPNGPFVRQVDGRPGRWEIIGGI